MRYLLSATILVLFLSGCTSAPNKQEGPEVSSLREASVTSDVDTNIFEAMEKANTSTISGIPLDEESKAQYETKVLNYQGQNYYVSYISYDANSGKRYVHYKICDEEKKPISDTLTVELFLTNEIPYPAYDGKWLPRKRHEGTGYSYGQSADAKVEVVKTLEGGKLLHVTQIGFAPYYVYETPSGITTFPYVD